MSQNYQAILYTAIDLHLRHGQILIEQISSKVSMFLVKLYYTNEYH